jgi:cathepsin L
LNKFADLSVEEYKALYLMNTTKTWEKELSEAKPFKQVNFAALDDDVNWASRGAVTPPKDQGQCGSCWSFSTTGAVEALNQIYTGNLNSLSEQNLIDCSGGYGTAGCNGGWPSEAMQYIIDNSGIDLEQDYPYTASQGGCNFQSSWTGASMRGIGNVNSGDEGDLTNHINNQPVSVCIDASHQSFQLYSSGIYYESACSSSSLDHAVLAIGYGSDNGDYYIVKNSWGTGWGMGGYIWMARNAGNNCGIATAAVVPLA